MKNFLLIAIALITLTSCKKKKEEDEKYTVTYTAYSKGFPYFVKYWDENNQWTTDSVRTNNYSRSVVQSKKGHKFNFFVQNGKQIMNDSIYAKISIGSNYDEDFAKFTNAGLNTHASVEVALTSPQ